MRWAIAALLGLSMLAACGGEHEPYPYPQSAHERFSMSCPEDSAVCRCTWDKITRTITYEDYEAALARFSETGLMEQRITHARTQCLEHNRE